MGGILEKVTVPSGTAYRHYIGAGSATVLYTRWSTGTITTKYVTADHLGSSTVVMSDSGGTLVNLSFGSYGARRGSNWTGTPSAGDWTQIGNATRHGFTGHEALDNLNLVHMNGRVFDPVLGRFLSADPFMPGILGSQAPNRYAYVGNRSQSLVDPSGFTPNGDVTETEPPVPRTFPQCPYQLPGIAEDCPFNYGWRWFSQSPDDIWIRDEIRVETWARWMEANGAGGTFRDPPPPRPAPPTPQPGTSEPAPQTQQQCARPPVERSFGDKFADAVVGFGDAFLIPILVRNMLDISGDIDYDSGAYAGGMIAGTLWDSSTIAVRSAAAVGGTRVGHALNHNPFVRVGPGRMPAAGNGLPAGTHVPRVSVGGPGGTHVDLRSRLPHLPPVGALVGGGNGC